MNTLNDMPTGKETKVVKINAVGALKRRIMDMGITKGVNIYIDKIAPLGDPIDVVIRGYNLSIRKEDAKKIEVE